MSHVFLRKVIILVFANLLAIPLLLIITAHGAVSKAYFPGKVGLWAEVSIFGPLFLLPACIATSIAMIRMGKERLAIITGLFPLATGFCVFVYWGFVSILQDWL